MTIATVFVDDSTHTNVGSLPAGVLAALYTTGSGGVKATPQDFINHPKAVHICQDNGSDDTADMIDSETGAATAADVVTWLPKARAAFNANKRPGQRWPGVYSNMSNLTGVANALVAAQFTDVPLWLARPGMSDTVAVAEIVAAIGPFPVVAVQVQFLTSIDVSVFSSDWLDNVSGMVIPVI